MAEAIERLLIIFFFLGLAAWFANDLRHQLRDGRVRLWRTLLWAPPDPTITRERNPINYWSFIAGKSLAVVAALILGMTYLYFSLRY